MIKQKLESAIKEALKNTIDKPVDILVSKTSNSQFGDYTSNIALRLAKSVDKTPYELAEEIVKNVDKVDGVEKIEIAKPGFINFFLKTSYLVKKAFEIGNAKHIQKPFYFGKNKKIIVEFAHPNTLKIFHIGHLRNISIGESVVRIMEFCGNKVIRANYQGDVGLHIAKALWALKKNLDANGGLDSLKNVDLKQKIKLIGKSYSEGTKAYEADSKAKDEILKFNAMIYEQKKDIKELWHETRKWSLEYYNKIYKRVYSRFDRLFFESEMTKRSMEIISDLYKKGILEKSEGAIIFNGKKYGLDTRVFLNSLGFPTYEGKELALAEKEFLEFGNIDKCIHVVTPEQTSFFKVTFKVEELLQSNKFLGKQLHLSYGWVKLKTGKMSSREGNVIEGDWLIDEVKKKIKDNFKCDDQTAEALAIGSVKYSFLKDNSQSEICFDFDESISIEGNSCPYLMYTFARTNSILNKENNQFYNYDQDLTTSTTEEKKLLQRIYQFSDVVYKSAENIAPNNIATYLMTLAQEYNYFYQLHPVLKAEGNLRNFRLLLTQAVNEILKKGLFLLGIKPVEKM